MTSSNQDMIFSSEEQVILMQSTTTRSEGLSPPYVVKDNVFVDIGQSCLMELLSLYNSNNNKNDEGDDEVLLTRAKMGSKRPEKMISHNDNNKTTLQRIIIGTQSSNKNKNNKEDENDDETDDKVSEYETIASSEWVNSIIRGDHMMWITPEVCKKKSLKNVMILIKRLIKTCATLRKSHLPSDQQNRMIDFNVQFAVYVS